jgi:hypothetical protein
MSRETLLFRISLVWFVVLVIGGAVLLLTL